MHTLILDEVQNIDQLSAFINDLKNNGSTFNGHDFEKEDGKKITLFNITQKFEEILYESRTGDRFKSNITKESPYFKFIIPRLKRMSPNEFHKFKVAFLILKDHFVSPSAKEPEELKTLGKKLKNLEDQIIPIDTFFSQTLLPAPFLKIKEQKISYKDLVYFDDRTKKEMHLIYEALFQKVAYLEDDTIQFRYQTIDEAFKKFAHCPHELFLMTDTILRTQISLDQKNSIKIPFLTTLFALQEHPDAKQLDPQFFRALIIPFNYVCTNQVVQESGTISLTLLLNQFFGTIQLNNSKFESPKLTWVEKAIQTTIKQLKDYYAESNHKLHFNLSCPHPILIENMQLLLRSLEGTQITLTLDCKIELEDKVIVVKQVLDNSSDRKCSLEQQLSEALLIK
jgi:hypothetical protein